MGLDPKPPGGPAAAPQALGEMDATARVLGAVLRVGVLLSAAIILLGMALFVHRRGVQVILLGPRGVPAGGAEDPATVQALLDALTGNEHVPTAVTDIGLLTLMVTPVISVIVSLVSFARTRDWTYVALATFVLCMLALGVVAGRL
ncbi:MAG TPA: DUF1634 domain-containing protein [bacterium]|nr:DUF1634 domain-containing protein [bacterium]